MEKYKESGDSEKKFKCSFQPEFKKDLKLWVSEDRRVAEKIFRLIDAIQKSPFTGIGKPKILEYFGSNVWSRRITQEHRLVYKVSDNRIDFLQCRYQY